MANVKIFNIIHKYFDVFSIFQEITKKEIKKPPLGLSGHNYLESYILSAIFFTLANIKCEINLNAVRNFSNLTHFTTYNRHAALKFLLSQAFFCGPANMLTVDLLLELTV